MKLLAKQTVTHLQWDGDGKNTDKTITEIEKLNPLLESIVWIVLNLSWMISLSYTACYIASKIYAK